MITVSMTSFDTILIIYKTKSFSIDVIRYFFEDLRFDIH